MKTLIEIIHRARPSKSTVPFTDDEIIDAVEAFILQAQQDAERIRDGEAWKAYAKLLKRLRKDSR